MDATADPHRHPPCPPPIRGAARPPFDLARVRDRGDAVGLSFSCGKDSIAAWLYLREQGFRVVPFYLALVPGLEFVEHSLRFYEAFFGTRVYRLLHPNLYRRLNNLGDQPLRRHRAIAAMAADGRMPLYDYPDAERGFRRTAGLRLNAWIAVGTKLADSAARASRLGTGYNPRRNVFSPVRNWATRDVVRILLDYRCPLPVDYQLFGRSFDGYDCRFLAPIRDRFPRDYATVLEWFPDAERQFARLEVARKNNQLRGARRG